MNLRESYEFPWNVFDKYLRKINIQPTLSKNGICEVVSASQILEALEKDERWAAIVQQAVQKAALRKQVGDALTK